jgi:Kdo2-lipid IVA lauroyltransferase/acyltransferase
MRQPNTSWTQDLIWRLEDAALEVFTWLIRVLPVDVASDMGGAFLRAVGPLTGANKTAKRNLLLAFPEKSEAEREDILKRQWENFGRYAAEFPQIDQLTPANGRLEIVGGERLREIAAKGEAAVLFSGHLSNFEVMAAVIMAEGVNCVITGRAANNPYVNERIIKSRERYGVNLFAPKGSEGTRELFAALKRGESIALLNDQKFNQGVAAPFFGHLCHTASGPTKLALRTSGKLVPMSVHRLKGARFRVEVHEPIVLAQTGDRGADIDRGVRQINAFIEARIREHPEEWWWMHKRWSNAVYDQLKAEGRG